MQRHAPLALLLAAAGLTALTACDSARPVAGAGGGAATDLATCTRCHGDPANGNAAPPRSLAGATDPATPAVGAHQRHLSGGTLRGPIACGDCHPVPGTVAAAGHMDGKVDVVFGTLARSAGVAPSWDGTALTCATYCHGASLQGGSKTAPVWTGGAAEAACGSCHGLPPPASSGHPTLTGSGTARCAGCHPGTVKADGTIDLAGGLHVNGTVDLAGGSGGSGCTACHGDPTRAAAIAAAPPAGTHGETATTTRAVGAHQAHLVDNTIRAAIACDECHVVPTSIPHATGTVNVTFGRLATTGGATPTWNGTSCSASYCHGGTLAAGGANTQPVWTAVDGSQRQCTSCHGAPPPTTTGHPAVTGGLGACAACHPATVKADGTIDVAGGKHINGTVDVASSGSCTACHGDATRTAGNPAAPPRDTLGNTATTAPGVGAHQAHLTGGALRSALACSDCHTVPSDTAHSAQPLDLTWGALARTGGVTPSWNGSALTCANYCHGATLPGGSKTSPVWTGGAGEAACGTCHGVPPPTSSGHPAVAGSGTTTCNACHPATVKADGTIDVAGGMHVNGALDVINLSCTSCHGGTLSGGTGASGANPVAAAPPRGTQGETATSTRAVGLHARHLTGTAFSTSVTCSNCHTVPTSTSHANGTVAVTFGGLAVTGGAAPSWNGTSCSASYCHGSFSGGAGANPVTWANATVPTLTCTSCHGDAPSTGQHGRSEHVAAGCAACHGTGYSSSSVNTALHLNGTKNVGGSGSSINSWNAATRSCAPQCHGTETW